MIIFTEAESIPETVLSIPTVFRTDEGREAENSGRENPNRSFRLPTSLLKRIPYDGTFSIKAKSARIDQRPVPALLS